MSNAIHHGPDGQALHALSDKYAKIFGPKYSELYQKNIVGHRLAHDMTIEEFRREPVLLGFGSPKGPEIGNIRNFRLKMRDGFEIEARLYLPATAKQGESLPCYINYHGGGWVIGNLGDDDSFVRHVVKNCQCAAIDIGYRLSPEHKYPVPVYDAWDAYKAIAESASEYGVDPSRLAVGGFSAGGHLSAVVSQLARDEGFPYPPCFQLLVIPVCDASVLDEDIQLRSDCPYESWREHYEAPFLSYARMSWFYRYFLPDRPSPQDLAKTLLSPIKASTLRSLPPALVVPAEIDVLRDEGIAYAQRLAKESGSFTELWLARRVPHPFPHQYDATDVAVQFRELAIKRLREAFAGKLDSRKSEFVSNL